MHKISRRKVQFEIHRLEAAGFPKPALGKIKAAIGEFLAEPGKRSGKRAKKVLERLWSAYWHRDRHTDDNVKRKALKLVKTANHSVSFDDLEVGAKAFARALKTADRRVEEEAMLREAEWREAGDGQLQQVVSFGQLRSIGKELRLCVGGKRWARNYLRQVEDGDIELWLLQMDGMRHTLIEVDVDDRSVSQCQTSDGETPEFTPALARAILSALDASGDDNEAFSQIGVFSVFGNASPSETEEHELDGGRRLRLWTFPEEKEIVVAVRRGPAGESWSRFRRQGGDRASSPCGLARQRRSRLQRRLPFWEEDHWGDGLGLGELFELALTRTRIFQELQTVVG